MAFERRLVPAAREHGRSGAVWAVVGWYVPGGAGVRIIGSLWPVLVIGSLGLVLGLLDAEQRTPSTVGEDTPARPRTRARRPVAPDGARRRSYGACGSQQRAADRSGDQHDDEQKQEERQHGRAPLPASSTD